MPTEPTGFESPHFRCRTLSRGGSSALTSAGEALSSVAEVGWLGFARRTASESPLPSRARSGRPALECPFLPTSLAKSPSSPSALAASPSPLGSSLASSAYFASHRARPGQTRSPLFVRHSSLLRRHALPRLNSRTASARLERSLLVSSRLHARRSRRLCSCWTVPARRVASQPTARVRMMFLHYSHSSRSNPALPVASVTGSRYPFASVIACFFLPRRLTSGLVRCSTCQTSSAVDGLDRVSGWETPRDGGGEIRSCSFRAR